MFHLIRSVNLDLKSESTMKKTISILALCSFSVLLPSSCSTAGKGPLASINEANSSARVIQSNSLNGLRSLYAKSSEARALGKNAKGILVFPKVLKAGLGVGVQGGNGTLFLADGSVRYYQTAAASYGFQAGVQEFGIALFLMDDDSMRELDGLGGWEVGSSPSLVIGDNAISGGISTTSMRKGTYGFMFNHNGLMAGGGLQGAKITRIQPRP